MSELIELIRTEPFVAVAFSVTAIAIGSGVCAVVCALWEYQE